MPKEKIFRIIVFHVLFVAFIFLSFYYFDDYLFDLSVSINSSVTHFFTFIRELQDAKNPIIACSALLLLAFLLNKYNALSQHKCIILAKISLYTLSAIAISGAAAHIIKFVTGRPRPNLFIHTQMPHFQWFEFENSLRSFPSAHTTTGISVIMVLFCFATKNPLWRFLLLFIGSLFIISHTMNLAHWFSDVIIGAYIATLTVLWLQARYDYLYEKLIEKALGLNRNKEYSIKSDD